LPARVGEQEALFESHSDLAAQGFQRHGAQVVAVDGNASGIRIMESSHQHRHGRFAAAAWPDDRDPFTGGDTQVESAQYRRAFVVTKRTSEKVIWPRNGGSSHRASSVRDGRRQVKELEDALDRSPGLLGNGNDASKLPCWRDELGVENARNVPSVMWWCNTNQPPKAKIATWPTSTGATSMLTMAR
jgi:hypothetical protein